MIHRHRFKFTSQQVPHAPIPHPFPKRLPGRRSPVRDAANRALIRDVLELGFEKRVLLICLDIRSHLSQKVRLRNAGGKMLDATNDAA